MKVEGFPLEVDESALAKTADLMIREGIIGTHKLRYAVQPGGCSGLRMQLFFDERSLEGDVEGEFIDEAGNELTFVIDRMSAPYAIGGRLYYEDGLMGGGFKVDNPNTAGTCACGDSFH